jgi:hypothetical protein
MSIVLNEYEWAENAIKNRELGKKPMETLGRVAKYYYENGYSKKEVRNKLDVFISACDPSASLVQWSDALDKVAKSVGKYPLIRLDGVDIYKDELDTIGELEGQQLQRLCFTLLCVSRYWDAVSPRNNHWVNTEDGEVLKLANISTSVKRQSLMFSELRSAGLLRFSKKIDNLNVQMLLDKPGVVGIHIQDFRNIGYQYMKYRGGKFVECECCGLTVKIPPQLRGRPPKYCSSCAAEIRMRQNVNAVMRKRGA